MRTTPPDDVSFRLQPGGRWLLVAKLGTGQAVADDPIIDLKTGQIFDSLEDGMRWVSPNGRLVFTDDAGPGIRVNELRTGAEIGRIPENWINCFSDDSQWLVAETDGVLHVYSLQSARPRSIELKTPSATPPHVRLGLTNDADHQSTCRFTSDSRRLVIYGERRLEIWNLEPPNCLRTTQEFSPIAISDDGERAYERSGRVVSILSGQTLVTGSGTKNDISGVRVQPAGWFLSQRDVQSSPLGSGWPAGQLRLGPYTVTVSADPTLENLGCDLLNADSSERISLPRWFFPTSPIPGSFREAWTLYSHPERFALMNQETGVVRVIDMPPVSNTGGRLLTALVLFALPGWWCWRQPREKQAHPATAAGSGTLGTIGSPEEAIVGKGKCPASRADAI